MRNVSRSWSGTESCEFNMNGRYSRPFDLRCGLLLMLDPLFRMTMPQITSRICSRRPHRRGSIAASGLRKTSEEARWKA
jgi:hypothetical protein